MIRRLDHHGVVTSIGLPPGASVSADKPNPPSPGSPRPRGRATRITSRRTTGLKGSHPVPPPETAGGRRRPPPVVAEDDGMDRLQKVLAAAGLGSRRNCEELITTGRVEIDRKVVTQLGTRVDPLRQEIRVDGERLPDPKRVVYMLSKPVGVVTTNFDPDGRPRVVDLVPGEQRLFAIGRLDRMSEGLILVTNDGDLANLLAHPRYGVEKKYLVQVAGVPTPETLDKLRRGIGLAEGMARAQHVHLKSQHKLSSVLEMVLDEGKNREIRRMLAHLGHKVHQLKRVAIGNLSLGGLLPGQCRQLTWAEVEALRKDALTQTAGHELRPTRGSRGPRPQGASRGPGRRPGGDRPGREQAPPRSGQGSQRRFSSGVGRPPRQDGSPPRPGRPRFLDRAGDDGAPAGRPAGGRPPAGGRGRSGTGTPTGRPPRPPAGGRPPRPPRIDGDARPQRPARPAAGDGPRPPLPGGRRRRPGKASSWRKKREG